MTGSIDNIKPLSLFGLLLFTSLGGPLHAAELPPTDEAAKDVSFVTFRQALLRAVARQDREYLLRVLAPDIRSSFGGDRGKDDFVRHWRLNSPKSEVWKELEWILAHGGSFFADGSFCAPYVYSKWPRSHDAYEYVAVVSKAVPVRQTLSKTSAEVARLNDAIVKALDERWWEKSPDEPVWVKADSAEGFVPRSELRSPIDYRACFKKRTNEWLMDALIAGD